MAALVGTMLAASAQEPAGKTKANRTIDPNDPKYGTIHLRTNLGSFKMLPKAEIAEGRVELDFTGTVLLSNFEGTIEKSGNIRLEYRGHGREVYFGQGKMVLTGRFRGIQWFGKNMTCTWRGDGIVRLFGEFDKNLFTGEYWYDDPTQKAQWGTYGVEAEVPQKRVFGTGTPIPRQRGGGTP